jgi:GTP-binding protein
MVAQYLGAHRPERLAFLLIDIRRPPQEEEKNLVSWLKTLGIPFQVIATKADKLPRARSTVALKSLASLGGIGPPISFSSLTGNGREELIAMVNQWQEKLAEGSPNSSPDKARGDIAKI